LPLGKLLSGLLGIRAFDLLEDGKCGYCVFDGLTGFAKMGVGISKVAQVISFALFILQFSGCN
jgi:hypothetical protein